MSGYDDAIREMATICTWCPPAAKMFRILIEAGARVEAENAELRARIVALETRYEDDGK